ncbi:GNAT family N-acetyltransferase [Serratia sp. SRS-8-S-2018]|uniref:GNAT family N-acetyltransferase n=1 Tax=Serratia sp. SRS-8-S-2018 TaxID=2591107 RepID=UPI00113FD108|nr:GNAT family N-acetyltransferase [Serratia sp. SRS-8-S-2018]TPW51400.1 GNAT family N-acetyltransferase [Serratia sp. SRS-8-S-2018]
MRNHKTGWSLSDFDTYQDAYSRYGGSVCSHPDVIRFLSENGPAPAFYGYWRKGELVCATYATDKHIRAGDAAYPFVFDDIIIPYNKHAGKIMLPFRTKQLSPYHAGDFHNCIYWTGLKRKTCVVKQDFSKATHKKRRLAYKKFLQAGGECRPVDHFSNAELSDIYCRLFRLRWGTSLPCYSGTALVEVFEALRHLVFGHVLLMRGEPCAYDLVFKAESPQWVFFDCINGGYDPAHAELSIGSILMYLNIQRAREICQAKNVKMAFSLGMDNPRWQYKQQWCNTFTLGRALAW